MVTLGNRLSCPCGHENVNHMRGRVNFPINQGAVNQGISTVSKNPSSSKVTNSAALALIAREFFPFITNRRAIRLADRIIRSLQISAGTFGKDGRLWRRHDAQPKRRCSGPYKGSEPRQCHATQIGRLSYISLIRSFFSTRDFYGFFD